MKTFAGVLLLTLTLGFCGGCGYQIGLFHHPQINSVAVAPVTNESAFYHAAADLRSALCERYNTDGSYALKRESNADAILHARVLEVTFSGASWSSSKDTETRGHYRDSDYYTATVEVEYALFLPGKVTPVVGPAKIKGSALFDYRVNLEAARRNGVKQALFDAAKRIVDATVEAW